jgi:hypothetical protein
VLAYVVVCLTATLVAGLTLFSGFGLGTLLMPVFAVFFPLDVAVAATAVVHLANNLFKIGLLGRWADWSVVARFGLPAAGAAVLGALLLSTVAETPPLLVYALMGRLCSITIVKLLISAIIAVFTCVELAPRLRGLAFDRKYIPWGGAISGFFGGLSGHQGALRSAFLLRAGLEKQAFLGTMVTCAVVVDVSRLTVYGASIYTKHFSALGQQGGLGLIVAATLAAFAGSFVGSRLVRKVTMEAIHRMVGILLLILALGLAAGII